MVSLRQRGPRPSYVGMAVPDNDSDVDSRGSDAFDGSDDEMEIDAGVDTPDQLANDRDGDGRVSKSRSKANTKTKTRSKGKGKAVGVDEAQPSASSSIPSYAYAGAAFVPTSLAFVAGQAISQGVLPPAYHEVIRASSAVLVKSRPGSGSTAANGKETEAQVYKWKLPGTESACFGPPTPFVTRLNGSPAHGGVGRAVWDSEDRSRGWSRRLRERRQERAVGLERSSPLKVPWQFWEGEAYWKEMFVGQAPGKAAVAAAAAAPEQSTTAKGKERAKGRSKGKEETLATDEDTTLQWIARDEVRLGFDKVGRVKLSNLCILNEAQAKAYLPRAKPVVSHVGKHKAQDQVVFEAYGSWPLSSIGSHADGYTFAAGGPIWGIDWCPGPSARQTQYIAVSTLADVDDHVKVGERRVRESKGSIQIWSVERRRGASGTGEGIEVDAANEVQGGMKLEMVICVKGGAAIEVKWMPLGAWDEESNGDRLPKLGILVAVQLDGSASFYPVHQPDVLRSALGKKMDEDAPIYVSAGEPLLRITTPDAVCTCVDWVTGTRIAVGLSNGHGALWDVDSVLKGEQTQDELLPAAYFSVSLAPVRTIAVARISPGGQDGLPAYGDDPTYVLFGSYDGALSLVDLADSASVIDVSRQRTPCLAAAWAVQIAAPIHADIDFSVNLVKVFGPIKYRQSIQTPHRGAVWSIATSDYHTTVVSASADGSVGLSNYQNGFLKRKSTTLLYQRLYEVDHDRHADEYRIIDDFLPQTMTLGQADSRISPKNQKAEAPHNPEFVGTHAWSPRVGVHKVTFNNANGIQNAGWLASGGDCGLGRVEWIQGALL